MIRFLSIRHLAVVDALELELEPGFNVLTGETGAGKSIVVGALGLLIGGRASGDLVRTGEERAVVQAVVDDADGREIILRREISAQGRSRAFINDALATTAALKEIGDRLVDLHGQHEHQTLLDPRNHVDLLDAFAGLGADLTGLAEAFHALRAARAHLDQLRLDDRQTRERLDLCRFQLAEIARVAPARGEDDELATTRRILANSERLVTLCSEAYGALYERDGALIDQLEHVWRAVEELAALDRAFAPFLEARGAVRSQLEDLAFSLRSYLGGIDSSPERLHDVESRLAELERLKKKYGPSLAEVLERQARLSEELDLLEGGSERVADLDRAVERAERAYLDRARQVSTRRREEGRRLAKRLQAELASVGMERTRFEVRFNDLDLPPERWTERGMDDVEFYCSPNPGEELRPLARIASGGELSRVMLALKTLATTDIAGKTLVFDEVDAGIGGATADKVGERLAALATRFQVLSVTHLPQIAVHAATHHRVSKSMTRERTTTTVERITGEERASELARLMTGTDSEAARASARALLASKSGSKDKTKGESERAKAKRASTGSASRGGAVRAEEEGE